MLSAGAADIAFDDRYSPEFFQFAIWMIQLIIIPMERIIATYHFFSNMQNSPHSIINTVIPVKKHTPPYQTSKIFFSCGKNLCNIPKISSGKTNAPHKTIPAVI
ncbi:MAG: hypothetical protein IKA65_09215 [Lentisphaeria bacterium]|nr:hypothetical protein [Lentisphaeria bacterium]